MTQNERFKIFRKELDLIKTNAMQNLAFDIISNADDYFFHIPASSSGKYHPPFAQGEGGLVRHTKAVMRIAYDLAKEKNFTDYATDIVVVASLAHDIKKQGDGKEKRTVKEHPELAYSYLSEVYNKSKKEICENDFMVIQHAVLTHMGEWGNVKPSNEYDKVVHEADYLASRKDFNMIFD